MNKKIITILSLLLCVLFVGCREADTVISSSDEVVEEHQELKDHLGERYLSSEVLLEETHTKTVEFTRTTTTTLFVVDTTTGKELVLMQKQTFDNELSDIVSFVSKPIEDEKLENAELVLAEDLCAIYLPETNSLLCRYGKNGEFFVEVVGVDKATAPIIEGVEAEFFAIDETTPRNAIVYCLTPDGERITAFYDAEQKTLEKLGDYYLGNIEIPHNIGDKKVTPYLNAVVICDKSDLYTPVEIVTAQDMKISGFFVPLSLQFDRNDSSRAVLCFITSEDYLGFLTFDENGNYKHSFVTEVQGEVTINTFLDNVIYFSTNEGRFAIDVREDKNHTPQLVK